METTTKRREYVHDLDKGEKPMYEKGQRVVLDQLDRPETDEPNGRHGTIEGVETITMRSVMVCPGRVSSTPTTEWSHYYRVKTDQGFVTAITGANDLVPETTPYEGEIIPDPIHPETQRPVLPSGLLRSIEYAHQSAASSKARMQRARVERMIREHRESAERYRREKEGLIEALESWLNAHPSARTRYQAAIDATLRRIGLLSPKPGTTSVTTQAGDTCKPTMRQNEERNGVELRFPDKPDDRTLSLLKSSGWRWARGSRCWYTRRNRDSLTFAAGLAGVPVPDAPSGPDPVDTAYEDQCAAMTGA